MKPSTHRSRDSSTSLANLCLPPRRQPPTLKDLQINGVFRKEGTDEDGPNAQAELLTRPIALVDTSSLGMLTVPFDALESALEDDVIATAAAMANIACMRTQLVESADHEQSSRLQDALSLRPEVGPPRGTSLV